VGATLDHVTMYPSPYMVLSEHGYTKHYYAGADRVAARIGGGNLNHDTVCVVVDDSIARRAEKLFWSCNSRVNDFEITHRDLEEMNIENIQGDEMAAMGMLDVNEVPSNLKAELKPNAKKIMDAIKWLLFPNPEFHPGENDEPEVYYYHSDHLGGASWITDGDGVPVQHLQYLPFGEPFVNQRAAGTTYKERYTFTGKERDEETGYGYFGARYMDHELMTSWLSVDPMSDKYPNISPYNYCMWNPIRLVDPNGMDTVISFNQNEPKEETFKAYYGKNYEKYYKEAQTKYKKNIRLTRHARQYDNSSDIIHVFAHGLDDAFGNYTGKMLWGNNESVDPYELRSILAGTQGSQVYQYNLEKKLGSVIMLHSCSSGLGFAQELSELIPNSLIIAPSNTLSLLRYCNREYVKDGGNWLFYYNGMMIYSHLGDFHSTRMLEKNLEILGTDKVLNLIKSNSFDDLFK